MVSIRTINLTYSVFPNKIPTRKFLPKIFPIYVLKLVEKQCWNHKTEMGPKGNRKKYNYRIYKFYCNFVLLIGIGTDKIRRNSV